MVILPDELLKLAQVTKERHSPPSVHEGWLEDPEIVVAATEECLRADRLTVEISL